MAIIVIAIVHGTVRYLFHLNQKVADAYTIYKVQLGRALLLGHRERFNSLAGKLDHSSHGKIPSVECRVSSEKAAPPFIV